MIVEATTITGPARNILEFFRSTRHVQLNASGVPRVQMSVVTFYRWNGRTGSVKASALTNEFVEVARAAGIEVDVVAERFRFDTRVVGELRRIVERRAPHIIETHHVKSHFLLRLSGLAKGRRWVAFHHGYTMPDIKMHVYNQFDRWSVRRADRIITVSRAFTRDLTRLGLPPDRIRVLHNSISAGEDKAVGRESEEAQRLRLSLGIQPNERVILAVGRLSREKGHIDLVAAFDQLRQIHPQVKARLVIVGDGPERQPVKRAVESLGLNERVTFVGQVSDVDTYYAMADVLALPSLSEGSPLVLLEAMAASLPVVATAVGGVPEIVTHNESALLVPPRDPHALAQAVGLLLTDTSLAAALADKARATVLSRHTPESHLRDRTAIYRELLPSTP